MTLIADQQILGREPIPPQDLKDLNDLRLIPIFNWYNHFHTFEDGKKWTISYLKQYSKQHLTDFSKINENRVPLWVGVLSRLSAQVTLPPVFHDRIQARIRALLTETATAKPTERASVADKVSNKISDAIASIEDEIDQFVRSKYKSYTFDAYEFLKKEDIKPVQAMKIIEYYLPLLQELVDVPKDQDVKEAYDHLTKSQLTNYTVFIKDILKDIQRYADNTKAVVVRKPRKKKAKSAFQLTSKLKYKKEDKEFKLVSVNPIDIIGASAVFTFNTKYRTLTKLSSSDSKLSCKGTTIINFDDTSITKKLRKPNEVLPKVIGAGKVSARKIMDEIKTKGSAANGRLNNDTIILKVIR